jgi:sec-independent protein translocase protein TatA
MLSIPEMALLGAAALMLFGPEQLPRVARKAGNVMREIQNTSHSFIRELERAADLQDEAAKAYEPPAYDPVPYDAASYEEKPYEDTLHGEEPYAAKPYEAQPYSDASTAAPYPMEPPEPDPERPAVGEKLAEPRPALGLLEADAARNGTAPAPPPLSDAAEPAPQADHPAHL